MSNAFQNPVMYTNECLAIAQNNIVLGKRVNRMNEKEFGKSEFKIGDTLNVRRPAMFEQETASVAFSAQAYTETSIPLVVNTQAHVDTSFTSAEMTLNLQDFSDRVLKPGIIRLAQGCDYAGYVNASNTVGNAVGTGVAPAAISELFDIGKKLDDFATPRDGDRSLAMDQAATAKMVGLATGFFNPQSQISSQYKEGLFVDTTGTIGLVMGMSQNVNRHTVGVATGSPLTNTAQGLADGWANTFDLNTDGWTNSTTGIVTAGDVITIATVHSVNPVTKQSTGQLMQFVVTETADSGASTGPATLTISPAPIYDGPFQNIDVQIADGKTITVLGTGGTAYADNIAWHKSAFQLAVVPLQDMSAFGTWGAVRSQDGFSLRVVRQALISSDTVANRVDMLYGWATVRPEWATKYRTA